ESELFGYVRGAFTGAVRPKEGLLATAEGGTIFLDEIGELPIDLQAKLLRAIQEKEVRPVGGTRRVKVDVRIVAATNRDLQAAVTNGSFRKDLFFRLNVISIKLPPLRERIMDIPMLVEHFLERYTAPGGATRRFSDEAMARLVSYEWPGNIRELENCVEHCLAMAAGTQLEAGDLPSPFQQAARMPPRPATEAGIRAMAEVERDAILAALSQVKGDKLLAAKLLGIGKTTIYRKLKEYAYAAQAGGAY
ncbi:MAG: sigma 54-interacting transcriptional regulator, partial [Terriglobales bacterium]